MSAWLADADGTAADAWRPLLIDADPSLAGGLAGIALALLAAVTDFDPGWDRMLLLSTGPCERHR